MVKLLFFRERLCSLEVKPALSGRQTCIKRSPEWRGDRLVQVDRLIQVPWNRVVIKKK